MRLARHMVLWSRDTQAAQATGGSTTSTGLPLGAVIGIVLAATAILCIGLAFICIWLSRKKALREEQDVDVEGDVVISYDAGIITAAELNRSPRKKIRKRSLSKNGISVDGFSLHSKGSLSTLQASQSYRQSFHLFSAATGAARPPSHQRHSRHSRRPSNSWIDGDAIHGPRVVKRRDSWRRSIRDSWPLRNLSMMRPTLPKLQDAGQGQSLSQERLSQQQRESLEQQQRQSFEQRQAYQHQQQYQHQRQQEQLQMSSAMPDPFTIPPRMLPQPPHPVLLTGGRETMACEDPNLTFNLEQAQRDAIIAATPTCRRSMQPRAPRRRQSSTDSTLSEILRSTERRLQEGGTSGVARRNRANSSPSKSLSRDNFHARSNSLAGGQNIYVPRLRTPSPTKHHASPTKTSPVKSSLIQPPPVVLSHGRQASQSSVVSEPDSLRDDAAAGAEVQTGLSSPSRTARASETEDRRRRSRSESMTSSVSSALSTLYSEDETEGAAGKTPTAAGSTTNHAGNHRMGHVLAAITNDPFVATTPTKSGTPVTMRTPSSAPVSRGTSRYAVLNNQSKAGHLSLPPPLATSSTGGPNPLGTISGNSKLLTGSPTRKPRNGGGGGGPLSGSGSVAAANDLYKLVSGPPRHAQASRSVIMVAPGGATAEAKTAQRATMPSAVSADPAALPEGASTDSIQQALADLIYGAGAARAAGEDDGDVTPRAPERVRARELRAVGSSPTLGRAETEWRNSMVVTMAAQGRAGGGGGGGGAAQEDQLAPLGGRGAVGAAMGPSSRLAPGVTRAPSKLRKVSTASSEYSQPSVAADISRTTSTSSGGRTVREAPVAMRAETPTQENTSSTSSTSNNNTEDDEGNSTSASENTNAIRNSMLAKSSSSIRTPTRRMSTTSSHRDSGETTPQVAAIVANLRRMNSQVSTYSVSSARSRTSVQLVSTPSAAAAARTGSPTPSSLRSGWGSQLRKGGTRHYLSMGQAPPQYQELGEQQQQRASVGGRSVASPGAQRKRKSGRESKRISIAEDGEEKDAMRRPPSRAGERDGARDSKLGRVRVTEMEVTSTGSPKRQTATTTTTTPVKRVSYLKNADATPERRSEDSLGLYDKDGFLIPSPEKVLIASGKKRKGSIRV